MRNWYILLFIFIIIFSCAKHEIFKGPDDGKITKAIQVPFGKLIDDRVGKDEKDPIDWKYIDMPNEDDLWCVFFWDNNKVKVEISLYSGSNDKLIEIKNNPNVKYDALSYHAKQGRYYIRINATSSASVYTMKCGTGAIPPSLTGGGNSEPLPE